MYPAQSLAEEMLSRGWRVKLSTDARGASFSGSFPDAVERMVVKSGSFALQSKLAKLMTPFRLLAGTMSMIAQMRRDRPAAVAGFGGYPAFPAMAAATLLRLPRLIHEQNGVLGRVNQVFAKRVTAIACGTWPTALPGSVQGQDIGNPIRAAIGAKAGAPYSPPGDWPMRLLVFGGSLGAGVMKIVPEALALMDQGLRQQLSVTHQARAEDHDAMTKAYADLGLRADIKPFIDDMPDQMSLAQLVICRAGASSIADLTVIGRPSILIPLGIAVRDEQTANARGLVEAGGAIAIQEAELTAEGLAGHITEILTDSARAEAMAAAALARGKPDAAAGLADLVEDIAGTNT